MLGHVVARYLVEQGCDVVTTESRYEGLPRDPLVEAVRRSSCEWIVNAAGRIKQKSDSPMELLLANSLLPLHLKSRMRPDQCLVQASTDCVFSGERGGYSVKDERDAVDAYGLSKILAEAVACDARFTVIRTSIIGPELEGGHGLMSWFLRQTESTEPTDPVRGFLNHRWNGITTLEWAKVSWEVLSGKHERNLPVLQPGVSPSVSKYELLQLIAHIWDREISIVPVAAPEAVDRTLVPTLPRPELKQQLREMKDWYYRQ